MDVHHSLPVHSLENFRLPVQYKALWSVQKDDRVISCVLRDHGRFGVEAHILVDGDVRICRRFRTKESAILWAGPDRVPPRRRAQKGAA